MSDRRARASVAGFDADGPHDHAAFRVGTGAVLDYDSQRGVGTVVGALPGSKPLGFHCTTIAGGGREIAPGTAVAFRVHAVGPGRWEAVDVTPVPSPP